MKTTIYDLLGMIKDGKAPKVISYENKVYHYVDEFKDYEFDNGGYCLFSDEFEKHYGIIAYLNDEVEILDEPKEDKIEKIDMFDYFTGYSFDDTSIDLLKHLEINFSVLNEKINKIIDKLNKE